MSQRRRACYEESPAFGEVVLRRRQTFPDAVRRSASRFPRVARAICLEETAAERRGRVFA